jgi:hypothetical protein
MKLLPVSVLALLFSLIAPARGASDADVTLLKVKRVVIEEGTVTIVVAEAKTRITLIRDDYDPKYKGDNWHGMPVTRVDVISNQATFTIKRQKRVEPEGLSDAAAANFKAAQEVDDKSWKMTLEAAKNLQEGKEVGRIGFYAPDIVIKGNMIDSITGFGYLYP